MSSNWSMMTSWNRARNSARRRANSSIGLTAGRRIDDNAVFSCHLSAVFLCVLDELDASLMRPMSAASDVLSSSWITYHRDHPQQQTIASANCTTAYHAERGVAKMITVPRYESGARSERELIPPPARIVCGSAFYSHPGLFPVEIHARWVPCPSHGPGLFPSVSVPGGHTPRRGESAQPWVRLPEGDVPTDRGPPHIPPPGGRHFGT